MTATAGHNSTLSSTQQRALHFAHFNKIEVEKAKKKAIEVEIKRLRKLAKADGCVMADLDYMARCAALEDPDIVPAELLRRTEIASWFALPVNFQPDMFVDRTPIDDRAYAEGNAAGLRGRDPISPYGAGSEPDQRWMQGWHGAQQEMAAAMQASMEAKLAANKADDGAIPEMDDNQDGGEQPANDDDEWTAADPAKQAAE